MSAGPKADNQLRRNIGRFGPEPEMLIASTLSPLRISQAAIIVAAGGAQIVLAAKAATTSIPSVFQNGSNTVEIGLVANLSQPSANITGVTNSAVETFAKRVDLIHDLVPAVTVIAWMGIPL
jgi:putative ABC transport system substrate-binding protein